VPLEVIKEGVPTEKPKNTSPPCLVVGEAWRRVVYFCQSIQHKFVRGFDSVSEH
jgi:hypothetical protein